jgi:copper resistance protein C
MSARRLRYIFGLLFFLLPVLAGSGDAAAHAVVVGSSLDKGPVRAFTKTIVVLRINAAIEPRFTQVFLLAAGGARRLKILPRSTRKTVRFELPGLAPGKYVIRYKLVAADGHLTEAILRVTVVGPKP